jgi:hypothetical protein
MERGCAKDSENVYLRCRKEAGTYNERLRSREGAAEMLGCSPSTLANYELGLTKVVPPDAVVMMADLYNAPELKSHYCANECPIGRGTTIATDVNSIELVTVRLMRALSASDVDGVKEKLLDIAADGKITDDERPALSEIVRSLDQIAQVIGELRLLGQKCLSQEANA